MFSSLISRFHSAFALAQVNAGATDGMKQCPPIAPPQQADALVANDHLRGFLSAVMRQRGKGASPTVNGSRSPGT